MLSSRGDRLRIIRLTVAWCLLFSCPALLRAQSTPPGSAIDGSSHRDVRHAAAATIPFDRLDYAVGEQIRNVVRNPSFFRRMPVQQIACDPDMFHFLVRRPEVMVNIWDVMGITKVRTQRISPDAFVADDGMGTRCRCQLVYQSPDLHVYVGTGSYDGTLSPRKVTGNCVCVLRTTKQRDKQGQWIVSGTMDVFLKLNSFGADLITRSVGPFIGKTADYNFMETARFIGEICELCRNSPHAAQLLASRLEKVTPDVRREFAQVVARLASQPQFSAAPGRSAVAATIMANDVHQYSSGDAGTEELTAEPPELRSMASSSDSTSNDQAAPHRPWSEHRVVPRKGSLFLRR